MGNLLRLPDRIATLLEDSFTLQMEECPHRVEAIVVRHIGELFLANGWAAFTRMHQLQHGWVLTFRYAGEGKLRIKMYDATGLRHPCCENGEAQHFTDSDNEEEGSDEE